MADQTRRDAMNKLQDKSVASGSIRFDDLLVWKPVAMVRELPAEVSMEFMKDFLPGPSILRHIFCWAKQLMWPPEPDPSCIGISVFELAINFTISTGINMPRVIRGTGKHPRYIDPWLQPEALLMPTQPWELAKAMAMASGYFARFPTEMHKRCKFLRFLGHYSLVRGFKTRPILPETERHLMFMQKVVSTEGLTFPTLTPSELSQSRVMPNWMMFAMKIGYFSCERWKERSVNRPCLVSFLRLCAFTSFGSFILFCSFLTLLLCWPATTASRRSVLDQTCPQAGST